MNNASVEDGGGNTCDVSSSWTAYMSNPEQINHVNFLANDIGNLYLDDRFSDVVFKVKGERVHAHKVILATRSNYFRALFYGGFKESHQSEVEIPEVSSASTFRILLKYIYSGCMNLNLKDNAIIELLILSNLFGFPNLELSLLKYLKYNISVQNVCIIFGTARLCRHQELAMEALQFIDNNALEIFQTDGFLSLRPDELLEILGRDSLYTDELDIFLAVSHWIEVNQEDTETESKILSAVRYPLMSLKELLSFVRDSQLVSSDDILESIRLKTLQPNDIRFRGQLKPNINIAHPSHGGQLIQGKISVGNVEQDSNDGVQKYGCTIHSVGENSGIIIEFDCPSIINYIKIQLYDDDFRSYSYYIEVSMNQQEWKRVIDYSDHLCRSTQRLWINPLVVKFIRIVGSDNTVSKSFHMVSIQVMYNTEDNDNIKFDDKGIITPKYNVATLSMNAAVICGFKNSMLDGNYKDYCLSYGYTCHSLGSGRIIVQLGQPYMLSSMRMLLWDCDDRQYSYYVEVSSNLWDWETVIDKSETLARSWQLITFKPQPVAFIRITGTYNSVNETFHCVYLEAPAQVPGETDIDQEFSTLQVAN